MGDATEAERDAYAERVKADNALVVRLACELDEAAQRLGYADAEELVMYG